MGANNAGRSYIYVDAHRYHAYLQDSIQFCVWDKAEKLQLWNQLIGQHAANAPRAAERVFKTHSRDGYLILLE